MFARRELVVIMVKEEGERTGYRGFLSSFLAEVDEVVGDRDLSSDVAELRPNSEEEVDLLAEWSRVVLVDFEFLGAHIS
jgi:hypothetical protein